MAERTASAHGARRATVGRTIVLATALALAGILLFGGALADEAAKSSSEAASGSPTEPAAYADSAKTAETDHLRAENSELQRRLQECETAASELDQALAENTALKTELSARDQHRQTTARAHTAQLNASELRLREHKDRLLGFETRIQELEASVARRDAEIEALRGRLDARDSAEARLKDRLETLRARLPAPEGGSLTAADVRKQAQADAARLADFFRQAQGVDNPQLWRQIREAENALHQSQSLLARADSARTVYRVRPGDSLPQVSMMFYGDEKQWVRLFDANRHVVEDPNRLLPGLTLVVP